MPFPPGYHPTPHGAPLVKAVADARWVISHAETTLHAAHACIVEALAGGASYAVLESAAEAALHARDELAEGAELIDQVAFDTYDPDHDGHVGVVSERDRAELERGRERVWTAQMTAAAIIDRLSPTPRTGAAVWPG